jgi:aspartyl-tRNA(Asn)/glutamyl-tRNA(Gln) amidotransferase subunit B
MTQPAGYEAVIGLEVHVQLATNTKIFCSCSNQFGSDANTQTCPVCLGLPGVLPVLNERAIEYAIRMGLATNCRITRFSTFARKNYFYPDSPKGYQISQFDQPICEEGWIMVPSGDGETKIRITRIHLEEDAGKSVHDEAYVDRNTTLIDLNRCGTPLIEIVSEPDFRTPQEAAAYMQKIRQFVRYLKISDGNMEEGSLRCDANISVRRVGETKLGTKTELKNMNSFKNVEKALEYEIRRQIDMVSNGEEITQATLLWDPVKEEARIMRTKEEAHDYRYFPEPDLVPVLVGDERIDEIRDSLPEMPDQRMQRFTESFHLPRYDAEVLTVNREIAEYFEEVAQATGEYKAASNWVMGEVMRILNDQKIDIVSFPVQPDRLAELIGLVTANTINSGAAKKVFEKMLGDSARPEELVERLGLKQVSDSGEIEKIVQEIIDRHPDEAERLRSGDKKLTGFFVGQIMRATQGKANPQVVNKILSDKLS